MLQALLRITYKRWILCLFIAFALIILVWLYWRPAATPQLLRLRTWMADPAAHADWSIRVGTRCGDALMIIPTDGYIGFG